MENDENIVKGHVQKNSAEGLGSAVIAGGTGFAVTHYALTKKLLPFDTAVADATVDKIEKMKLTGGLASTGGGMMDGASLAGGVIKEKIYLNMLKENKLARFLHYVGGRHIVAAAVGIIAGIAGLIVGKTIFGSRDSNNNMQEFEPATVKLVLPPEQFHAIEKSLNEGKDPDWKSRVEEKKAAAETAPKRE